MSPAGSCRCCTLAALLTLLVCCKLGICSKSRDHPHPGEPELLSTRIDNDFSIFVINLRAQTHRKRMLATFLEAADLEGTFVTAEPSTSLLVSHLLSQQETQGAKSEVAAWQSHRGIWDHIASEKIPHALILEDDIEFEADAKELLQHIMDGLPSDWAIIYFGHCLEADPLGTSIFEVPHHRVLPAVHPLCLHSYALSLHGARILLSEVTSIVDGVDERVKQTFQANADMKAFAVHPPVFTQLPPAPGDHSIHKEPGMCCDFTQPKLRHSIVGAAVHLLMQQEWGRVVEDT